MHIFLDCDGVLADFDGAGEILWGMSPRAYEKKVGSTEFWTELEQQQDFYGTLPLMSDAMELYNGVKHLNPTILTGCPWGGWAEAQKRQWAKTNFPGVPVITCKSELKYTYGKPGDVLIDDYVKYMSAWEEMGGVFVHHTSALSSLLQLSVLLEKNHGIHLI